MPMPSNARRPNGNRPAVANHPPLSLTAVPWRFLRIGADLTSLAEPVISAEGLRYIEEDAARWQQRRGGAEGGGADVPLTSEELIGRHRRPSSAVEAASSGAVSGYADNDSDDEDDDAADTAPLAQFNPFSSSFQMPPSSLNSTRDVLHARSPSSSDSLPIIASLSSTSASVDACAELQALADEEERRKRKGVIAADLLAHYGDQKSVQDEERERTRKRERSKWEQTKDPKDAARTRGDGGGVMVGGLGLEPADTSASTLPPSLSAPEGELEEEQRRLSSLSVESDGERGAGTEEMPDMSDFIKLYEDEDEPSYPAMLWRQKERLTRAVDVPQPVLDEVAHFDRQRAALRGGKRPTTRLPRVRAEEGQVRLRFNLGEGADYIEEAAVRPSRASSPPHLPRLQGGRGQGQRYGRQWYLPVRQWQVKEEQKERMELSRAEDEGMRGLQVDAYHGDEWRERLTALRHSLPSLYCSQAFKAFLTRGGGRVRLPHYLHHVDALDERKEEEEERKAHQLALHSSATNTANPTTSSSPAQAAPKGRDPAAEQRSLPQPVQLLQAMPKRGKDDGLMGEDEEGEGRGEGEDEEGEADQLLEYMREVRLREVSLAGVRVVKEREKETEERERRLKEREQMRLRAGSAAPPFAAVDADAEAVDSGDEVDLDHMFSVADYPCKLGGE